MTNKISRSPQELADLVLQGMTLRQVAALEGVSHQTISYHVRRVLGLRYAKNNGETCVVVGCDRPAKIKRMCVLHYNRVLSTGEPGPPQPMKKAPRTCKLCGAEWADKGQLNAHHRCWSCGQLSPGSVRRTIAANKASKEIRRRHKAEWASLYQEFVRAGDQE